MKKEATKIDYGGEVVRRDGDRLTIRRPNGTVKVLQLNSESTKTQQQFAAQVNVNNIMNSYKKGNPIMHLNRIEGRYADMSQIGDYQSMLDTVIKARETFETLPSKLRNRFQNDPGKLIEFMNDPKNKEEGIKIGLFSKKDPEVNPVLDELKTLNKNLTPKPKPKPQNTEE